MASVSPCARLIPASLLICALLPHAAFAEHHRTSGFDELVIYDAGTHERGIPGVLLGESSEGQKVEFSPAIHVHRYYYNGKKEYQGPIISGGPTIVVARHPCTSETMYIEVDLPGGAPLISYDKHSITYVYSHNRVKLLFTRTGLFCGDERVKIVNKPGHGVLRRVDEAFSDVWECAEDHHQKSRLTGSLREACQATGTVAKGTYGAVETAAAEVVDRATAVLKQFPGIQQLNSLGEDSDATEYKESVRQAAETQKDEAMKFLPTIR